MTAEISTAAIIAQPKKSTQIRSGYEIEGPLDNARGTDYSSGR